MEIKRLLEASLGERLTEGETVLMGEAMLSKSLIQISVDGRGCVPSLLFDLRPNYRGGNEDNGDLFQKVPCRQCPQPCSRPPPSHASTRDSWTLTGKLGSKFSKPGFNGTRTVKFQIFKLDLEKPEEPESKLPISVGSLKKQENSRKTCILLHRLC